MYGVVLLAALTATEQAPAHGWTKTHGYGVCYGPCYGVCYTGWQGPVHANGGWGMPYGGYWAGYACWGGCGGYASAAYGMPMPTVQLPSTYAPLDAPKEEKEKEKAKPRPGIMDKDLDDDLDVKPKGGTKKKDVDIDDSQSQAKVIFELPQDAKLFVDDVLIENAGARKTFRTPALKKGEQYYYELRAEVIRDGKKIVENRKITLSAGDVIQAKFNINRDTTGVANVAPR